MESHESNIDIRLRYLSYSSLLTLHSCPRKYQLYKLNAQLSPERNTDTDSDSNITFAFGHVVGDGIQQVLQNKSLDSIYWNAFLSWHADYFDRDEKRMKSFPEAIAAINTFHHMWSNGYLSSDYELVYFTNKKGELVPACELSFLIRMPDGFVYRGFVDAVLRNKSTGQVIVLELKTTGLSVVNPAMYKNSAQAIGYSIVLDFIFPELTEYSVIYSIYKTKVREIETLTFNKSYLQRSVWMTELMLDVEMIKMYAENNIFPMHGESCLAFFRECDYYQNCTLNTRFLTKPLDESITAEVIKSEDMFEFQITMEDLIQAQIKKGESAQAKREKAEKENEQPLIMTEGDVLL